MYPNFAQYDTPGRCPTPLDDDSYSHLNLTFDQVVNITKTKVSDTTCQYVKTDYRPSLNCYTRSLLTEGQNLESILIGLHGSSMSRDFCLETFNKLPKSECLQNTDSDGFMACALGLIQNISIDVTLPMYISHVLFFTRLMND